MGDSDHVTIMDDPTMELFSEIVRCGALDRVHYGLDYFDAVSYTHLDVYKRQVRMCVSDRDYGMTSVKVEVFGSVFIPDFTAFPFDYVDVV